MSDLKVLRDSNFRFPAFSVATFPEFSSLWVVEDSTGFRIDIQDGLRPVGDISQVTPQSAFLTFCDFLV